MPGPCSDVAGTDVSKNIDIRMGLLKKRQLYTGKSDIKNGKKKSDVVARGKAMQKRNSNQFTDEGDVE